MLVHIKRQLDSAILMVCRYNQTTLRRLVHHLKQSVKSVFLPTKQRNEVIKKLVIFDESNAVYLPYL